MIEQQHHEMILDKTYPSGTDEWYCPTCGRRLRMDYAPEFKKTILEAGDEFAIHSGGKGGLQMGPMKVGSDENIDLENEPGVSDQDPRLSPWITWLNKIDFEHFWKNES
jgi:hypothetical protein